jgi:hypothetical protein
LKSALRLERGNRALKMCDGTAPLFRHKPQFFVVLHSLAQRGLEARNLVCHVALQRGVFCANGAELE